VVVSVLRENATRWESLSTADRDRLEVMARAVVSRLLDEPTRRLRAVTEEGPAYVYVQALRELFALEPRSGGRSADAEVAPAEVTSLEARRRRS